MILSSFYRRKKGFKKKWGGTLYYRIYMRYIGYIGWIVVDYDGIWSIMVKSGRFGRFRSISVDFDENPGGDPWF